MPSKTVLDKVVEAIGLLAEPGGASRPAIAKAVKSAHGEVAAALLKKALAAGVAKGTLVQTGQRFALAGVEIAARPEDTVDTTVLKAGSGPPCERGDTVDMAYVGSLQADGTVFDKAKSFTFTLGAGDVIKGWDRGLEGMRAGGKRRLTVPPKLGYGKKGCAPDIPPDATLHFRVELKQIA